MKKAVQFWVFSYEHGYFVRWAVVDKSNGCVVGTIELFVGNSACKVKGLAIKNALLFALPFYEKERCFGTVIIQLKHSKMMHLELLGETITALGAQPIYCQNPPTAFNFYSAKYVTYSRNLIHMIEDDILADRCRQP